MKEQHLQQYYDIVNQLYDSTHSGFACQHPACGDFTKLTLAKKQAQPSEPKIANARQQSLIEDENELPPVPVFASLDELITSAKSCDRCRLCHTRKNVVTGMGVLTPDVFVVGEGPGANEDEQGLPFVGRGGQYLDKWLESIDFSRTTNCYIANIVKCRPPQNRDPMKDEIEACVGYLNQQIAFLKPKVIFACGRIAAQTLTGRTSALASLRQKIHSYQDIPLVITYHPAGVLRNPDLRRPVWEDLKFLKNLLEELPKN